MKAAMEKGYLDGPIENNLQTKLNDKTNNLVLAVCASRGEERAVWLRNLVIRELLMLEEQHQRSAKIWECAKDTPDTSNTKYSANEKNPVVGATESSVH